MPFKIERNIRLINAWLYAITRISQNDLSI